MRILTIGLIVLGVVVSVPHADSKSDTRPTIANEEDFRRAMKELSNAGRWGADGFGRRKSSSQLPVLSTQ